MHCRKAKEEGLRYSTKTYPKVNKDSLIWTLWLWLLGYSSTQVLLLSQISPSFLQTYHESLSSDLELQYALFAYFPVYNAKLNRWIQSLENVVSDLPSWGAPFSCEFSNKPRKALRTIFLNPGLFLGTSFAKSIFWKVRLAFVHFCCLSSFDSVRLVFYCCCNKLAQSVVAQNKRQLPYSL